MKKLFPILLIFLTVNLFGQNKSILKPFQENGKWGFINAYNDTVIEPKFDLLKKEKDGFYIVDIFGRKKKLGVLGGKAGVIDSLGQTVIPIKYDAIKYLGNGIFKFGYWGHYFPDINQGIINKENEILIPPRYRSIKDLGDYYLVRKTIDSVIKKTKTGGRIHQINTYGLYNKKGEIALPVKYQRIDPLNNGYFAIKKDGKYALFSKKLKQLTKFNYIVIGNFFSGFSKARKESGFGFLNLKGEEQIPFNYKMCSIFLDGYAHITKKDGTQALIDKAQKPLLKNNKFDHILGRPYNNQIFAIKDGKYGIINLAGKVLLPFEYDKIKQEYHGITLLRKDGKWQVWDVFKKELLPRKYDYVILTERDIAEIITFGIFRKKQNSQSLAIVKIGKKWGVINEKGEIIEPFSVSKDRYLLKKYSK